MTTEFGQSVVSAAAATAKRLQKGGDQAVLTFGRRVIQKIVVSPERVDVTMKVTALISELAIEPTARPADCPDHFILSSPVRLNRLGRKKTLIVSDADGIHTRVNDSMVMAIARAMKWDLEIRAGDSLNTIAKRDGVSSSYITRVMPLAFLAPDIVEAICEGRQPLALKVKALSAQLPLDWTEQRRILGFAEL